VITGEPWAADRVNNLIVITSILLAAALSIHRFYRPGREWLIVCFLLFFAGGDGQPLGDDEGLKSIVRANIGQQPAVLFDRLLETALTGIREDDVTVLFARVEAS